jgi:hypothetical protein
MSRENENKKIDKVRLLLDTPNKKIANQKEDTYLTSLQKRLMSINKPYKAPQSISIKKNIKDNGDLTPQVVIHRRTVPIFKEIESKVESNIEQKIEIKEPISDDNDLFEVERVDFPSDLPEFIEVKPKRSDDKLNVLKVDKKDEDIQDDESSSLPEWKQVEDEEKTSKIDEEKVKTLKIEEEKDVEPKTNKFIVVDDEADWTIQDSKEITDKTEDESNIWETITKDSNKKEGIPVKNNKKQRFLKKISRKSKGFEKDKSEIIENKNQDLKNNNTKFNEHFLGVEDKNGYILGDFKLYKKEIPISESEKRTVHFFSKGKPEDGEATRLPQGYEVIINRETGIPYIRRKKVK